MCRILARSQSNSISPWNSITRFKHTYVVCINQDSWLGQDASVYGVRGGGKDVSGAWAIPGQLRKTLTGSTPAASTNSLFQISIERQQLSLRVPQPNGLPGSSRASSGIQNLHYHHVDCKRRWAGGLHLAAHDCRQIRQRVVITRIERTRGDLLLLFAFQAHMDSVRANGPGETGLAIDLEILAIERTVT